MLGIANKARQGARLEKFDGKDLIFFFFWSFFRAAPVAPGGSQARGRVGAVAAGIHHSHSNARSKPCL